MSCLAHLGRKTHSKANSVRPTRLRKRTSLSREAHGILATGMCVGIWRYKMKIAITGAAGFVGTHLATRLLAEGHELVLLDRRRQTPQDNERISSIATDLSDVHFLETVLRGCEAVAHCAGVNREIGNGTFQRVHVEGTR